ncbi:MAG: NAD(P)/FAD-dependent oxidoreductase [Spirochaetales bacterium]|nr:NAD(P)/FAD-dependent oxidoreductase [Spirochaetales bacterium]
MNQDAVIVGSGLGGLCAGAKLAKSGKKVLVLEQFRIPGGYATCYNRKNITFEVGLQELDGFDEYDVKKTIFTELDIFSRVDFIRLPGVKRYVLDNKNIKLHCRRETSEKELCELYPEDTRGILKFYKVITAMRDELCRLPMKRARILALLPLFPILYPTVTRYLFTRLGPFVEKHITNSQLKQILLANLFYFHNKINDLSLLYFSAGQGGYCRDSHYIKKGSRELSNALCSVIQEHGGQVICRAEVSNIIVDAGKVRGVEYQQNGETKTVYSSLVISNISRQNTMKLLPSSRNSLKQQKKAEKKSLSMSFTQINIAFTVNLKDHGVDTYQTFFTEHSIQNLQDYQDQIDGDYDIRPFVFTDYGQIESGLTEKGISYAVVLIPDEMKNWRQLEGQKYKDRKEDVSRMIFKRLEKVYPGITSHIDFFEVATPKTMMRYTKNPEGVVYGLAQKPLQSGIFRPGIKSSLKNLFYASAWTYPGGGFTGSLWSGWSCAHEILK